MNIKEVAEKAGVSITTVSRVLNNPEMVSEKTKNKVLTVMDQLNYTPNWFARHLQKSRTNVIGMLIPDTLEQSYMEITKGVEKIARQKNCSIILCSTEFDPDMEADYITTLTERSIDGLILTSPSIDRKQFDRLKSRDVPFVFIGKTGFMEEANTVCTNNDTAAEEAVEYLIQSGRKNIAIVLSDHPQSDNHDKLQDADALCRNMDCRCLIPTSCMRTILRKTATSHSADCLIYRSVQMLYSSQRILWLSGRSRN